jgi:hypothetical protein
MRLVNGGRVASVVLAFGLVSSVRGQGCMAVRGSGHCSGRMVQTVGVASASGADRKWQLGLGYRRFKSDRHFVGSREIDLPRHLVVENISNFYDLFAERSVSDRVSLSLVLPFVASQRRAAYEHDDIHRYATHANGLADIRLTAYAWLFKPETSERGNLRIGVGLKLPTGDYDAQDNFHSKTGVVRRAVDQSIQPGDGGYGVTLEASGFAELASHLRAYIGGFYLLNPEEENGVLTDVAGDNPYFRTMSITDQYMARAGLICHADPQKSLSAGLGVRVEGVPATDLVGGNEGFRRPGYTVSIEPGISISWGSWDAAFAIPVAIYRNRVPDLTGTWEGRGRSPGDASFADYMITASIVHYL